jgi:hypothetical protein
VGIAAQDLPFLCALSERFPRFSLESQALLLTTHWIFKAWRVYPSDASFLPGEAVPPGRWFIVGMSPPGYPSAWLLPSRACFRFTWRVNFSVYATPNCGNSFRPS